MTVIVYKSTDSSAPTLTGEANSLVNLLDKCLVTGYGSKAAAGWTKPYTGTNAATFQQGAGSMMYLMVNDNGPGAGTYKEARIRGYETCSAHDTGSGPFPTAAQMTSGAFVRKSASNDTTQRAWTVAADNMFFHALFASGDGRNRWWYFGDIISYKTGGDTYSCVIGARASENSSSTAGNVDTPSRMFGFPSAITGRYIARSYTGTGGSDNFYLGSDASRVRWASVSLNDIGSSSLISSATMAFPSLVDGGLYLSRVYINEHTASVHRGELPGVWAPLHATPLVNGDTVSGTGALSGKTFEAFDVSDGGQLMLETSNTWR